MALEFTKLSEVENIETPAAEATVIIEDEGSIKRTPMKNISVDKVLNESGKLKNEVLPEGYPYEAETTTRVLKGEGDCYFDGSSVFADIRDSLMSALVRNSGSDVVVVIDGVDYYTKIEYDSAGGGFDAQLSGDYVNIGCMATMDSGSLKAATVPEAKTVTVQIYTEEPQTVTNAIDHKFLPDGYPYEETVTAEVVQKECTAKFTAGWDYATLDASIKPFNGKDVIVYVGNERFVTKCEYADGAYKILLGGNFVDLLENLTDIGMTFLSRSDKGEAATYEVKVCTLEEQTTVVPMAEKFLPDTIARTEDIPEEFSGSWNDLTDKPFGDETISITWDGNTDGLVNVGTLYKASDIILSDEEIKGAVVQTSQNNEIVNETQVSSIWDDMVSAGAVTRNCVYFEEFCVIRSPGTYFEKTFNEAGLYFRNWGADSPYTSSFVFERTNKVEQKYLPENALCVKITGQTKDDLVASHTYEEIAAAIESGKTVTAQISCDDFYNTLGYFSSRNEFDKYCIFAVHSPYSSKTYECFVSNYVVDLIDRAGDKVADATGETVTASEFNSLLESLRDAGFLKS